MTDGEKRNEVRRVLKRWARADKERKTAEDTIKTICDEIDAVTDIRAQALDGMPHGTDVHKPTEERGIKVLTLKERYRPRLAEYEKKIADLDELCDKVRYGLLLVSPDEEYILTERFYKRRSMDEIAAEMHLAIASAWRRERMACDKIAEAWGL